ncbi:MAG: Gldg family protein [Planctomycetales bacterium]|nr:Gldg family protein [Planctomycetales bacterium]
MNWSVLTAIFKRNFVSYFSNPTGYVFIVVFVFLNSIGAFWPHEFFNANLANLDQLNVYMPFILLIFIPAITMSVWADERRQGTDELLLTIPASDLEVVLGKFLAILSIFSVSLAFSMFSNYCVLRTLGQPDFGLYVGTYIGYWMVGMAMLATGMVASFLTGNLTVSFILGAAFNAPLAFSAYVDTIIKNPTLLYLVQRWSLYEQIRDFQRGVISISSVSYFVMITAVMLYVCVVLIGRRHWLGGRDGSSMLGHYLVRAISLLVFAAGLNLFLSHHDFLRPDITSEQLSSLAPKTRKLIDDLETKHPVMIEAFISPTVPREYVPARLNLLSTLDELNSLGGGKIEVTIHNLEPFSKEASLAEDKYGITPNRVISKVRGAWKEEEIFLGVAFSCGLDKVVVPFLDKGIPAEYELIRSICTVAQQERATIGVLKTDVPLHGQFNMQTMSNSQDQRIITELRKQYDVVEVDASQPITRRFDALLAVQPSTLTPEQMENFIAAVKAGQPTAIFEDPFPAFFGGVVGTAQPRRPQQNQMMMMMGQQPPPQPKGEIHRLWDLLGVDLLGDGQTLVWQDYNPYSTFTLPPEWVFIDSGNGANEPFNEDNLISSDLQRVLFVSPGSWRKQNTSKLKFTALAQTGQRTGEVEVSDVMADQLGGMRGLSTIRRDPTGERYITAVQIKGKLPPPKRVLGDDENLFKQSGFTRAGAANFCAEDPEGEPKASAEGDQQGAKAAKPASDEEPEINVVLVADIDCLIDAFFDIRSRGEDEQSDVQWDFDNVTFVLNTLDLLADDKRFIDIRKRRFEHRLLDKVQEKTEDARKDAQKKREQFREEFDTARAKEQEKLDKEVEKIRSDESLSRTEKQINSLMAERAGNERLRAKVAKLERERDQQIKSIERDLELKIQQVQDGYKLWAVALPPLPPLLVGLFVFFHRRQQEREGVAKTRLR